MMDYHDLSRAERLTYLATLRDSHEVRTRVTVYDRNEDEIELFDGVVESGQVDVDGVARTFTMTVQDPRLKISFDPIGQVFVDKFIGVEYGVRVGGDWVDVPVFYGPIVGYSRSGHEVFIEAAGKETLMMPPVKQPALPTPSDRRVTTQIREIAALYGETKFDLGAAAGAKVPKTFEVDPAKIKENGVWWYLRQLSESVNMNLFYDGRGFLCLRPYRPDDIVYTFENDVLSEPRIGFSMAEVRNRVEVFVKDDKDRDVMKARVDLAASHPLSAQSLSRNGRPRILLEQVKLDSTKVTSKRARALADRILRQRAMQAVNVEFDALPVPHLEPYSTCRLHTATIDMTFSLRKFTLGLGATSMSVGYTRSMPLAAYKSRSRKVRT